MVIGSGKDRLKEATVSIIVPVYNTAGFLEKCITSLLDQTYPDLEIILVNNGSTDNSAAVLEKFANLDSRVRVVTKQHGLAGSARNAGLDAATGQYIMFVDSDDYVTPNYVERLLSTLQEYGTEMTQCCFYRVEKGEARQYLPYQKTGVYSGRELSVLQASFVGLSTPQTALWNKIYRRRIFDTLRFSEEREYEDIALAHKLIYPQQRVAWIPDPLYYWVIHDKSGTTAPDYRMGRASEIYNYADRVRFFQSVGDDELAALNMKRCYYVAAQHVYNIKKIHGDQTVLDDFRGLIREYFPELVKMSRFGLRTKLRITFIRMFPAAFGGFSLRHKLNFQI